MKYVYLLPLVLCSCVVTPSRFDEYQRAVEKKDMAIAQSTVAYVEGGIEAPEHLANVEKSQDAPASVVVKAKSDVAALTEWGDFALALGKTLGVPGIITGAGMLALDRIRNNRRRKRGEPVDTDGDGEPDATDPHPLDPTKQSEASVS